MTEPGAASRALRPPGATFARRLSIAISSSFSNQLSKELCGFSWSGRCPIAGICGSGGIAEAKAHSET